MIDRAPLATVLGVRVDGEVAASSASDLLITVFGELMRPVGGEAWTQTLVATLDLLGVEEKAARQAISRLGDRGWLTSQRVGRRNRLRLTPWATGVLVRGAERIYDLGRRTEPWAGTWLVLLASIPEARRAVRGPLGVRLGWAGFGSVGQGVWVCPRVERQSEVQDVLDQSGIEGVTLFRSEMTDLGDPIDLARRAWQPDQLASEYESFLAVAQALRPRDEAAATVALIRLVDAWRRFPLLDPDLPPELLPEGWPGRRAAHTFAGQRAKWGPTATMWWGATGRAFD